MSQFTIEYFVVSCIPPETITEQLHCLGKRRLNYSYLLRWLISVYKPDVFSLSTALKIAHHKNRFSSTDILYFSTTVKVYINCKIIHNGITHHDAYIFLQLTPMITSTISIHPRPFMPSFSSYTARILFRMYILC